MDFTFIFCNLHVESVVFRLDNNVFDTFFLKVVVYVNSLNWLLNVVDERSVNVPSTVKFGRAYFCFKHVLIIVEAGSSCQGCLLG